MKKQLSTEKQHAGTLQDAASMWFLLSLFVLVFLGIRLSKILKFIDSRHAFGVAFSHARNKLLTKIKRDTHHLSCAANGKKKKKLVLFIDKTDKSTKQNNFNFTSLLNQTKSNKQLKFYLIN